jgi:hypothetical protein
LGESIRLAESFALIWKRTRISNSASAFRLIVRLTLLNVSTITMRCRPWLEPSCDQVGELRAGVSTAAVIAGAEAELVFLP